MSNPRSKSGPCEKCGTYRQRLQRDHKIPRHRGGSDCEDNIQFLCANCHEDKSRADHSEHLKAKWQDPIWAAKIRAGQRKYWSDHPEELAARNEKVRQDLRRRREARNGGLRG